jgi:hypothetical protein
MKRVVKISIIVSLLLVYTSTVISQVMELSGPAIHPLLTEEEFVPKQVIPPSTRSLSDASAVESYLIAMDGAPPRLDSLTTSEGVLIPDALAKLNTKRDQVRQTRRLFKQRLAFLWTGKLLQYNEAYDGFKVEAGPERYRTNWGEVSVHPDRPPALFIAVPSDPQKEELISKVNAGVPVAVRVLMQGRSKTMVYRFSKKPGSVEEAVPQIAIRIDVDEIQYFLASDVN